jgi:hypothetical protein
VHSDDSPADGVALRFTKPDLCSCFGTDACDLQVTFGCTSASPFPAALGHCSVAPLLRDCLSFNGSLPTAGLGEFVATCTHPAQSLPRRCNMHQCNAQTHEREPQTAGVPPPPPHHPGTVPIRAATRTATYNRCCYRWGILKKASTHSLSKLSCRHLTPHLLEPLPPAAAAPRRYRRSSCRDSC